MKKNNIFKILILIGILFTLISFFKNIYYISNYFNVNLYDRWMASKIAAENQNPYFFKWNKNFPLSLRDPFSNNNFQVNLTYETPAMILLSYFLKSFSYNALKYFWYISEWFLLLFSIFLLINSAKYKNEKQLLAAIFLIIFPSSYFWSTHIIKGSSFIIIIFLLSISLYLYQKNSHKSFLASFILGITSTLYVPLAITGIAFLMQKRYKQFFGFFSGMIFLVGLTILKFGRNIWFSYFRMLHIHFIKNIPFQRSLKITGNPAYISGLDKNFFFFRDFQLSNFNITNLARILLDKEISFYVILFGLFLTLLFFFYFVYKSKNFYKTIFYALCYAYVISILFLPVYLYHNLIFLPITMLFILSNNNFNLRKIHFGKK